MMSGKPFERPSAEEVEAALDRELPDILAGGLSVLFCGINPGLYSAAVGCHFARPGNRFWKALHQSGFTPRRLEPWEQAELVRHGCGLTNLVERATAVAGELDSDELVRGRERLADKVERFRPAVVAVLGIGAYRTAFRDRRARAGPQEETIRGARLWVLPNPSGLNAHYQPDDLARLFGELRQTLTGGRRTIDILEHNALAWDDEVAGGNPWSVPADPETIAEAREGRWSILLTPTRPVPRAWFPPLDGAEVLCLASGGGQQGPVLAAAGATVTVLDASPRQLGQDRSVAERESLEIATVLGSMTDLSGFADASFDLVVHPVSNVFVPDVRPVWREAHRILRPGGLLLSGFSNGVVYVFDPDALDRGELRVTHSLPYSDLDALGGTRLDEAIAAKRPLEFGHTLTDQIGGQLDAGFVLCGFYEDRTPGRVLDEHLPTFAATRALKPRAGSPAPSGSSDE